MTPLVFLPGFLCDERLWQAQVAAITAPTKVVDLRHCQDFEAMIAAVSEISWPKFHLVGFSMGGYVAQVFSVKFPARVVL